MNIKRKLLIAALPFAFCLPTVTHALTLKAADTQPTGLPAVAAIESMGKKLEAETDGELKLQMFAGGVLGGEKEVVEQMQLDAVQLARVSLGVVGPVVPDVNVFNMPFIFRDHDHMRKVIDGEVGQEILDRITESEFNLVGLAWMDAGTRNFYTNEPVRSIEDLKGMKIRMMENPLFLETMDALGGNGIAMGTGETYSALQTGVIDGAENNPPVMFAQNHHQVIKHYTLSGHLIIPEPLVMSKGSWNKLTPEQQALVKKLARDAQMEQRKLWDEQVEESTEKLKAAGVEFIEVDKKPFYDATAPIREKYGADYADLIKRIEAVQ